MDVKEIKERMTAAQIDTIRIDFSDIYGINRGKIVPAGRLEEVLEEGINCAKPTFSLDLSYGIPPGTGTADEVNYEDMSVIPDPATFSIVPYQQGTARFIGDLYAYDKPFPYSPRWLLKRVLTMYQEKGMVPISATELEFFIFRQEGETVNYYSDKPSSVYTMNPRVDPLDLMRTLQNTLLAMGMPVLYTNHEFFQGQYEINWRHADALTVADQAFTFKAVCKELGAMHNLLVTFMGRPKPEMGGSGYHIHFSVNDARSGRNSFDDPARPDGMSEMMRHFIGGQMRHAKGMSLFFAPNINSYKRYVLNSFAPYYLAWGHDNRTTYIRIPRERGAATRVENRAPCASANPYLVNALGLIAGLDGIQNRLDPGEPYVGDVYQEAPGKLETVPLYLRDAIEELKRDQVLCDAIGPEIVQNVVAMRTAEEEKFRTHVTEWEFKEYSYHL